MLFLTGTPEMYGAFKEKNLYNYYKILSNIN